MRKRNIQRLSERRPLWSDGGSYCEGCRKFVFPSEETAHQKLEDLKAAPKVRKQKHSHLLHVYRLRTSEVVRWSVLLSFGTAFRAVWTGRR
jgi:hypothetical protein